MDDIHIGVYSDFLNYYSQEIITILEKVDRQALFEVVRCIIKTNQQRGMVYCCGNGGSAGLAGHFSHNLNWDVSESLPQEKKIKSIALQEQACHITGIANDRHYDQVFVAQLKNLLENHDLVIGISASGNAESVIEAIHYAKTRGVNTIIITGQGGGKLKQLGGIQIDIPSQDQQVTEDIQNIVCHMIVRILFYHYYPDNHSLKQFADIARLREKDSYLLQRKQEEGFCDQKESMP